MLSRIEAHRVMAVLEKAIERLQLLTLLDQESAAANAASSQPSAGSEGAAGAGDSAAAAAHHADPNRGVGAMLQEQRRLETRYEQLLAATQKAKPNPQDPQLDPLCFAHVKDPAELALFEELAQVSQALKVQSKMLCRQLKDNPNDEHNWRKVVHERQELLNMLLACIRELGSGAAASSAVDGRSGGLAAAGAAPVASYEGFARKVLDEQAASIWADGLVKKEKETNQNVKQLQHEVRKEREDKEEQLRKKHEEIAGLKTELRLLKQEVRDHMEKTKAESEAKAEALQREAHGDQRELTEALMHLEALTTTEERVHDVLSSHTTTKATALRSQQEEMEDRATKAVAERQNDRAKREALKESLRSRLSERQLSKEAAEEAKRSRDEMTRQKQEFRSRQEQVNDARYQAATKLQASVKGFFTRSVLTVLKKKLMKKKK